MEQQKNNRVYVFIPIGLPGMKKEVLNTVLKKKFEEKKVPYSQISSKEIRKELLEQQKTVNPQATHAELINANMNQGRIDFNSQIESHLRNISQDSKNQVHAVFLEKNHPPNALSPRLNRLSSLVENLDMYVIPVIPLIEEEKVSFRDGNREVKYPFSFNYFMTCMHRVQTRENHVTLPASGPDSIEAVMQFFNWFRDIDIEEYLNEEFDLKINMYIPFSIDDNKNQYPEELKNIFVKILSKVTAEGKSIDEELLQTFTNLYEKHLSDIIINLPEEDLFDKHVGAFLKKNIPEFMDIPVDENYVLETFKCLTGMPRKYIQFNILAPDIKQDTAEEIGQYIRKAYTSLARYVPDLKKYSNSKVEKLLKPKVILDRYTRINLKGDTFKLEIPLLLIIPQKLVLGICIIDSKVPKFVYNFSSIKLVQNKLAPEDVKAIWRHFFGLEGVYCNKYQNSQRLLETKEIYEVYKINNQEVYVYKEPSSLKVFTSFEVC